MENAPVRNLPALPMGDFRPEVAALAQRYRRANGPVMSLVNRLGGTLERQMALVPQTLRSQLERGVAAALTMAYAAAGPGMRVTQAMGPRGGTWAAMASGAMGGAGGVPTALAELPVAITLLFGAIREAARAEGFDPEDPAVRAECIRVFGAGSPLAADDGVNTSFLSARLTLTGPALQKMIATVAPKLAVAMGQKLAAQAVPVLGAVSGAALNAAFLSYYREIAHVRFGLLRLTVLHGAEPVMAAFAGAVEAPRVERA
jgi:hypothetical protein